MVQFLLPRGADPTANTTDGGSQVLKKAAFGAPAPMLDALLNASAQHRSAFPNATWIGRADLVAFLLNHGADIVRIPNNPNITDNARKLGVMNALCRAAWRGQTAAVEMLLERGAYSGTRGTNEKSALEFAEMEGHTESVILGWKLIVGGRISTSQTTAVAFSSRNLVAMRAI